MTFVFTTLSCLFGVLQYPIYIYRNQEKYFLSIGCENFSSLDKAVAEAKARNCSCEKTHKILALLLDEKVGK